MRSHRNALVLFAAVVSALTAAACSGGAATGKAGSGGSPSDALQGQAGRDSPGGTDAASDDTKTDWPADGGSGDTGVGDGPGSVADSATDGAGGRGGAGGGGSGGAAAPGVNAGAGPWGVPVSGGPAPSGTFAAAHVSVDRSKVAGNVGPGFAGFSVEKTQMMNSTLTGKNARLTALYRLLGPTSLRIGGADVDRSTWAPGALPGAGGPPYGNTVGTAMVDGLADFVKATGARVVYGVNFLSNNVSNTVAEATYAYQKLGTSIDGFEVGNEINNYGSWTSLKTQWESFGTAITRALPGAGLIGPATTRRTADTFAVPFAADEAAKFGSKLVLLTQHFYLADAGSSGATVSALQTIRSDIISVSSTLRDAALKNKVPGGWRMDECNTFSGHGKAGISDTLIAGLWSIDFMFQVALNGGSGVSFHGAEDGMDGSTPFYYEPIKEVDGVVTAVMPVYHAMLLFYLAGQGPVRATTVTTTNPNFTAYALSYTGDASLSVVLVNKNASTGVDATVDTGAPVAHASAIYLRGTPAGVLTAAATTVNLAGAPVTAAGSWSRQPPFQQKTSGNSVSVFVPPATAALVRVQ